MIDETTDFSYADPKDGRFKQLAIRSIERLTGQKRLRRLYLEQQAIGYSERNFWATAIQALELRLAYSEQALAQVPATGPLVVVANHPYGVLDGIMISHLVSQRRGDFRVLANGVLYRSPEARPYILPIDFNESQEALATNLESRRIAINWIRDGGALVIFPGGTVSTARKAVGPAVDPRWKPFTAKLIHAGRATVVPICFVGQNSRLFQVASHLSTTLRLSLLFREVANKIGSTQRIEIGEPLAYQDLMAIKDRQHLMDDLRRRVYALHPHATNPRRARRLSRYYKVA